jgi:tripartite-type tricarboxylate transporter receptor subunit TctC
VLVHPGVPIHSIGELIAFAKKNPKQLNYASAGAGSGIHLAAVLFASLAGVELTHIPYKGTGPALNDLVGGHVGLYFSSLAPAISLVKDNKVRALAVTAGKRSAQFPDLPTVIEAGLPGYEAVLRYGIVAPSGTPRPIVDKLNAALRAALTAPEIQTRLAADGAEVLMSTPEEYAADIDAEETKWSQIVRASGAKAE